MKLESVMSRVGVSEAETRSCQPTVYGFVVTDIGDDDDCLWSLGNTGWGPELLWFVCLHFYRTALLVRNAAKVFVNDAQTVQEMTHGCAILISHWSMARELGAVHVRQPGSQSCLGNLKKVLEVLFRRK